MFPFKTITSGVILLLLAVAGLVYVIARPKPLIQSSQPEELAATETEPSPSPSPSPQESPDDAPRRQETPVTVRLKSHAPKIKTFVVNLLTPAMAEKFIAPATVKLTASARPNRGLVKITFYHGEFGVSECQSVDPPVESKRTKIGEAVSPPFEFTWTDVPTGAYKIFAVATYETGEEQLSEPKVIIVNDAESYASASWVGWRPPYSDSARPTQDITLMPEPTPVPSTNDCPSITVKRLDQSTGWTDPITFKAELEGGIVPVDITYDWTISAGEIVAGAGTSTITVNLNRVFEKRIVASVEVRRLNAICSSTASSIVKFAQPRWMGEDERSTLLEFRAKLERIADLKERQDLQVYMFTQGDSETCVDSDFLKDASLLKKYLVEVVRLREEHVLIRNGGAVEESNPNVAGIDLQIRSSDVVVEDWLEDAIHQSARRSVRPCNGFSMSTVKHAAPTSFNRSCPDVEEEISYRTDSSTSRGEINTCPYNPKDPQNSVVQVQLFSSFSEGTYGNVPTFRYWANGGRIQHGNWRGIWDLSEVKLRPGYYNAVAVSDDSCGCPSVNLTSVAVTNFCTPCLTLSEWCDRENPRKHHFVARVGTFAIARDTTYRWQSNKGIIISGQGTEKITVDTSMLAEGEEFEVTVGVGGLLRYCVNQLSIQAIVGDCAPSPVKFDEYGVVRMPGRRVRRRPPEFEEIQLPTAEVPETGTTEPPPDKVEPRLKEKEWMKVSWAPQVKSDESFSITVTYNRTTETFEVSNMPGEISEELKLGARFKSLKDRYGPGYETFAVARLFVAGIECNNCNQDQYQSLDAEKVEWSWPVSPGRKGTHVFNIELWTKGEPRDKQSGLPSIALDKVWSRNNLKVEVTAPFLTKNTVFAGGGLCAVLGLGLCVRGLKIYRIGDTYNVGQAVAVGRNVTMNNTTVNQQSDKKTDSGDKNDA